MSNSFQLVIAGADQPHRFTAFVPAEVGAGRAAEHAFEWRTDSPSLPMTILALESAALSGKPPEGDAHIRFGRELFDRVFGGAVGALWRERRAALALGERLRLVVRPDPNSARPLLNLPWEYLRDGEQFVALDWRTPLSRLPWNLRAALLPPLIEPLRMLVVISSPAGLGANELLNTRLEEDVILGALESARRSGLVQIEFAPNGSPERLAAYLEEIDPHILHFVGHGVFDTSEDSGYLLMEDPNGGRLEVKNGEFADLLRQHARSLRLVFLSACQSAVNSRNDAYADLAPRLLAQGVPAVVAMQFSVLNVSAMQFGDELYKGVAAGRPLDEAMVAARALLRHGLNTVDFATPTLYLADPACVRVEAGRIGAGAVRQAVADLSGTPRVQRFVGRNAELRELQTGLDPQHGSWRAAILYGLGGMGKTALAARLADRMAARFDGVKSMRMAPTTTAQDVLDQVSAFLLRLDARLNNRLVSQLISEFTALKGQPLPLEAKASALVEILTATRLLLILDNYEDVLPERARVSRAASGGEGQPAPLVDPELPRLIGLLLEGVPGPSRFLFTSRADFAPLEPGRLTGAIHHLPLDEMPFRDAIYLMDTLQPLAALPVADVREVRPVAAVAAPAAPPAYTKHGLHEKLGGHPYTLTLFAEHVARSSLDAVMRELASVRKEVIDFTLLDRAAAELTERARTLLRRAAIYDEPVPLQALAYMLGDEQNAVPDVRDEVASLLSWGLISQPPDSRSGEAEPLYSVHALVRDWGLSGIGAEERKELWGRAAEYWLAVARGSTDLGDVLRARHYLFLAGRYEEAFSIVGVAYELLFRWGHIELLLALLDESIRTMTGQPQALAQGSKANVFTALGEYKEAEKLYRQVLDIFRGLGDLSAEAVTLHQLGVLHQRQGEYEQARTMYMQSLAIEQRLGDKAGVASTLHQLANLHERQGEYEQARAMYMQSLAIKQQLGNKAGLAITLHQLGSLHERQGEYEQARDKYMQSLAIKQQLGDKAGVAISLHQLGNLHERQGEYEQARDMYMQSLAIAQQLGDKAGMASTLHQLGILHEGQGEYEQARDMYTQSLAIKQQLGNKAGMATSLHQLGSLHERKGEYEQARDMYMQSLAIKQQLGNKAGLAITLAQLGLLNRREGRLKEAVAMLAQAFVLFEQLGSPQRNQARRDLAQLREQMGEEAVDAALRGVLSPVAAGDGTGQPDA